MLRGPPVERRRRHRFQTLEKMFPKVGKCRRGFQPLASGRPGLITPAKAYTFGLPRIGKAGGTPAIQISEVGIK